MIVKQNQTSGLAYTVMLLVCVLGLWLSMGSRAEAFPAAYPYSSVEDEQTFTARDYRVLTSPARKVNNTLRVTAELRLDVDGIAKTLRVDEGHDSLAVFKHYQSLLLARNDVVLYECHGRDCGQSNYWANDVFRHAKLYGRDAEQRYMVSARRAEGKAIISVIYAVERGNRQVVVYVQQLTAPLASVAPYLPGAGVTEFFVIDQLSMDLSFVPDPQKMAGILETATQAPDKHLYLIGYRPDQYVSVQESIEKSRQAAEVVADLLYRKGVARNRLHVFGMGPLIQISETGRTGNRIEVLLLAP